MTENRRGDWMQTYTGRDFWPLDPHPDDVCIIDIAHALSNMCRYAGHTMEFYSVAQHSVLVSENVDPEFALWGLMHDASEAYVVDIPRPLKPSLSGYKDIEGRVMRAVCDKCGLPHEMPKDVKRVDNAILADEKRCLMSPEPRDWSLLEPELGIDIVPTPPSEAKGEFIDRFWDLTK